MKKHTEEDDEPYQAYLPINNHIKRIEEMLVLLKVDLKEDNEIMDKLRKDEQVLNEKSNQERLALHNNLMDHCSKLVADMREMNAANKSETHDLKFQLQALNQDKIRMQQNLIVLENKINETDKDIGFKRRSKALNKKK